MVAKDTAQQQAEEAEAKVCMSEMLNTFIPLPLTQHFPPLLLSR